MKEFEKWWEENKNNIPYDPIHDDKNCANIGWKAALKWVLNYPDLIDHYMLDYVKEELSGE